MWTFFFKQKTAYNIDATAWRAELGPSEPSTGAFPAASFIHSTFPVCPTAMVPSTRAFSSRSNEYVLSLGPETLIFFPASYSLTVPVVISVFVFTLGPGPVCFVFVSVWTLVCASAACVPARKQTDTAIVRIRFIVSLLSDDLRVVRS